MKVAIVCPASRDYRLEVVNRMNRGKHRMFGNDLRKSLAEATEDYYWDQRNEDFTLASMIHATIKRGCDWIYGSRIADR